jgi:hypothetical protein
VTHRIDIKAEWDDFVSQKALVEPEDAEDFLAVLYAWRDEAVTDALRAGEPVHDPDCNAIGFSGEGRCIEPALGNGFCAGHGGSDA